jgi:hypothetical protein
MYIYISIYEPEEISKLRVGLLFRIIHKSACDKKKRENLRYDACDLYVCMYVECLYVHKDKATCNKKKRENLRHDSCDLYVCMYVCIKCAHVLTHRFHMHTRMLQMHKYMHKYAYM